MTDDNGNDRSQKTVAELLALHGNSTESGRRRQRRSTEREPEPTDDQRRDISDTAPQAIINRIHEEGGPDAGADEGARQVQGHAQPAAPPEPTPAPAPQPPAPQPPAPQRQAPPPQQESPQQASQPLRAQPQQRQVPQSKAPQSKAPQSKAPQPPAPEQPSTPPREPPKQQPPQQASQPLRAQPQQDRQSQQTQQPPPSKQSQPAARPWGPRRGPLRPARRPEPEPSTDQFPALDRPPDSPDRAEGTLDAEGRPGSQAGPQVPSGAPPAGLSKWRKRRGQQQPAAETDVGIVPPVPPDVGEPPGSPVEQALSGPPDTVTGGGAQTGDFTPSYDTGEQSLPVDDYAGDDFDPYSERYVHDYADDYADDYGSETADEGDYPDDYPDDYGEDYADDYGDYADEFDYVDDPYQELDEPEYLDEDVLDEDSEFDEFEELEDEPASPARQWIALAGQLALGVVAGAGVWLGFSWLWSEFPSAALIAALIVTVGVVWVVRKVRHADDTQTTVLAVLVGLIVTVSPAALLLLDR